MTEFRRATWVLVGVALLTTAFIVTIWLAFDLPSAMVPPLLIPAWIGLMVRGREPVSPSQRSLLYVEAGAMAALLVGLILVFVFGVYAAK